MGRENWVKELRAAREKRAWNNLHRRNPECVFCAVLSKAVCCSQRVISQSQHQPFWSGWGLTWLQAQNSQRAHLNTALSSSFTPQQPYPRALSRIPQRTFQETRPRVQNSSQVENRKAVDPCTTEHEHMEKCVIFAGALLLLAPSGILGPSPWLSSAVVSVRAGLCCAGCHAWLHGSEFGTNSQEPQGKMPTLGSRC